MAIRYQTIAKFAAESGYTEKAIRSKIDEGVWLEGRQWLRAPDNRILIDIHGYEQWVERRPETSRRDRTTSA